MLMFMVQVSKGCRILVVQVDAPVVAKECLLQCCRNKLNCCFGCKVQEQTKLLVVLVFSRDIFFCKSMTSP
jgi:hypothetical protein